MLSRLCVMLPHVPLASGLCRHASLLDTVIPAVQEEQRPTVTAEPFALVPPLQKGEDERRQIWITGIRFFSVSF